MPADALCQLGRAGIIAVVPAEGPGPAGSRGPAGTSRTGSAGGGSHKGERSAPRTLCAALFGSGDERRRAAVAGVAEERMLVMSITTRKPT